MKLKNGGLAESRLNDVVSAFPATLSVFHRHGLDACCGGAHPVAEAARRHGVDLDELIRELTAVIEVS